MTGPVARLVLALAKYVRRRNGMPLGAPGGLRAMFDRSPGASSFAGFWRCWNPIFGYVLGRNVFAPLRRVLPSSLSLVLTFVVCGVLHDLVTPAVRGSPAFLFTPWFQFLGIGVLLGSAPRMDASSRSWPVRAGVNIADGALPGTGPGIPGCPGWMPCRWCADCTTDIICVGRIRAGRFKAISDVGSDLKNQFSGCLPASAAAGYSALDAGANPPSMFYPAT
jgi:hypothetical protein